jgi:endogenous inhibitor of DNA gyrase (YacG/DUF329 family)
MSRVVSCPHCGKSVDWTTANRYRPFCSERCKLIDFGAWATEKYRVPAAEEKDKTEDVPPAAPPVAR